MTCAVCCSIVVSARRGHIAGAHVETAAARGDDRRPVEQARERFQIERRRHDDEAQIVAQGLLALDREREPQVRVDAALVEFVEQHAAVIRERRILLQHAREDPLGDDLDPRLAPDSRIQPRAVACAPADRFAEQLRDAGRDRACRQAPRLQHDELAPGEPSRIEQRERHDRALAGSGRRLQQDPAAARERRRERRQGLADRQLRQRAARRGGRARGHEVAGHGPYCTVKARPCAAARRAFGLLGRELARLPPSGL